jgi:hypothetical protein
LLIISSGLKIFLAMIPASCIEDIRFCFPVTTYLLGQI